MRAQHDMAATYLPASGVHDRDCKWACQWNAEQRERGEPESLCPRTDHAYCATCRADAQRRGVSYDPH